MTFVPTATVRHLGPVYCGLKEPSFDILCTHFELPLCRDNPAIERKEAFPVGVKRVCQIKQFVFIPL